MAEHVNSETKIELAGEFLTQQMNHWMLFPLVIAVTGGVSSYLPIEKPDLLMWVCCALIPILTFVVRSKIKHFFPFLLLNLVIIALTFVIPAENILSHVFCAVCGVGYFLHSFVIRLRAESMYTTPFPPAFGIGLSIFCVLFMHKVSDKAWDNYYVTSLIICCALYLLVYYMNHFLDFLTVNRSSSGSIPSVEMFRSGFGLVAGYTFAGILLLVLSTNFTWLETFFALLKKALIAGLRLFFSLFKGGTVEEAVSTEETAVDSGMGELLPESGDPSLFWEFMERLVGILFVCGAIYLAYKLIVLIYRYLKERFGLHFWQRKFGETSDGTADIRERCEIRKESSFNREEHTLFGFLNPAERVRRQYKKKLLASSVQLANGEKERLSLFTARESEGRLGTSGMADIYEKARYSAETITAEDVKEMKAACR